MNKLLCILTLLFLSGCANLDRVTFYMKCQEMHGRIGNNCVLDVPKSSFVSIDGDTIKVDYSDNEL